jgi:hypothetical protein
MYGRLDFLSSFEACGRLLSEDSANRLSLPNLEFAATIQHQGRSWFIFFIIDLGRFKRILLARHGWSSIMLHFFAANDSCAILKHY